MGLIDPENSVHLLTYLPTYPFTYLLKSSRKQEMYLKELGLYIGGQVCPPFIGVPKPYTLDTNKGRVIGLSVLNLVTFGVE